MAYRTYATKEQTINDIARRRTIVQLSAKAVEEGGKRFLLKDTNNDNYPQCKEYYEYTKPPKRKGTHPFLIWGVVWVLVAIWNILS